MSFITSCFAALTLLLFSSSLKSEEEIPKTPVKMGLQFLKQGPAHFLVLNFENHPLWHTYWKNPGDAGLPLKNVFSVKGAPVNFEEMEWPAPKRFIEPGDLWAYGNEGAYSFFYKISPAHLKQWQGQEIELKSTWLVCKHICIPGQQTLHFKLNADGLTSTETPEIGPYPEAVLQERLKALPVPASIPEYLDLKLIKGKGDKSLVLRYEIKKNGDVSFLKNVNALYPFPLSPFDFHHEMLSTAPNGQVSGSMEIGWDGEYLDPAEALPANGIFKKPYALKFLFSDPVQKKVLVIEKTFAQFDVAGASSQASPPPAVAPTSTPLPSSAGDNSLAPPSSPALTADLSPESTSSLFYYLVLAFVGGLILNVMPCVLPVISLKLFGLIKYKSESRKVIFRHNLFYTLGIIATFLVLATAILSLKSLGTHVGWGFQLQSPAFIATMVVGLFIFSLNLFGLFEFAVPGGRTLGNLTTGDHFVGDFLSGVLATVLSTPCSAPFLGTALTFAFTSSPLEIYAVFTMIGLGLAFPFILTALCPSLVAFLPRPGRWMNDLKKILGVTLLVTIVWLFDVYSSLVGSTLHLAKLGAVLVLILVGFLLYKKRKVAGSLGFATALLLFVYVNTLVPSHSEEGKMDLLHDKQAKGLDWQAWSEAKMEEHKSKGEDVFIDFTAKWCFTCKVNEKLVLETDDFKTLVREKNLKLLIGDWTRRDELIGNFLKKHGLVGVPAYFIQKKDGTLINLGETVSIGRIRERLD